MLENKIEKLIEEARHLGSKYAKGSGVMAQIRRNSAAAGLKSMRQMRDSARKKSDNVNANFLDAESRIYSASRSPKSPEALHNKSILNKVDKTGKSFTGYNKEMTSFLSRHNKELKSAKK